MYACFYRLGGEIVVEGVLPGGLVGLVVEIAHHGAHALKGRPGLGQLHLGNSLGGLRSDFNGLFGLEILGLELEIQCISGFRDVAHLRKALDHPSEGRVALLIGVEIPQTARNMIRMAYICAKNT